MPALSTPKAVDSLLVQVIVDNATDNLSSVPSFVETEIAARARRRGPHWVLGGGCLCCAAHGLSCLVTTESGGESHAVLFDTGPDPGVFELNVSRLALDLAPTEAIVLSHGHWDHGGAMLRALQMVRDDNGGRPVTCHVHPEMFHTRAVTRPDGSLLVMQDVPSERDLAAEGGTLVSTREPQTIAGGTQWISGEIPRVTAFEKGFPGQRRQNPETGAWEPDEVMPDERFLAINVAGKGLVVLTACSHAGVINVLSHARESFPGVPLHAVIGGLHLSGTNERIIPETVAGLAEFGLSVIGAGHCTGWRAVTALANAFGDRVLVPIAVGKRLRF